MLAEILETYTYDDYKKWEGDWELINGIAYAMSPFALHSHQIISLKIAKQLDDSIKECRNCYAIMEGEVKFNYETVVRPDIMLKCGEIDDISITPLIIFEVTNKASRQRDEIMKFNLYMQEGVLYYAIVYLEEKKVRIYKLIDGKYIKISELKKEIFKTDDLKCNIEVDFSKVFK